jgi:hypothetical protein
MLVQHMRRPQVLDPNHFLDHLADDARLSYWATGKRKALSKKPLAA